MVDFVVRHLALLELIACLFCGALIIAPSRHKVYLVMAILIPILAAPRRLFEADVATLRPHFGIASAHPTLITSVFALVLVVSVLRWSRQQFKHAVVGFLLLSLLACAVVFVWGSTPAHWAGYLTWVTAFIAWLGGLAIGRQLATDDAAQRWLTWVIVGVISAELAISTLQVLQYGFFAVEATDQGLTRARGTFGHPGDEGKWLVAMIALLLPNLTMRRSKDAVLLTYGGILGAIFCIGLSASRSNMAAIIVLLFAWTVIATDKNSKIAGRKLLIGAAVGFLPFVGVYVLRFRADPDGGSRPQLLAAAFEQMRRTPWSGTGLNSYVEVVGRYDEATARGLPVHNAFLLLAAEVGIPLFVATVGVVSLLSIRIVRIHYVERANPHTGAYLALLCALIVISVSGWGGLKDAILPSLAFAAACLIGAVYTGYQRERLRSSAIKAHDASVAPVVHA
jgi:hypothetical protein